MQRCCPPKGLSRRLVGDSVGLFKALSDPNRVTILATLADADEEVCVCDFTDGLPLNQPTVSHHLRILREARLIECERRATWVYYRLADGALERVNAALAVIFRRKVHA